MCVYDITERVYLHSNNMLINVCGGKNTATKIFFGGEGGGVSANLPQVLESRILPVSTNKHPK